jgi:tripartite ATP-independent transporter DctM subunit
MMGVPLFAIMALLGLYSFSQIGIETSAVIIEIYKMAQAPTLISIPLFTFSGYILAESKSPQRLIRFARAGLSWFPGSITIVVLLICSFFTAFTGASGVTIIALGGLMYPMLREEGYDDKFSLGLITTAGSLGLLFPPSLPVILYGMVAKVDIDKLFRAGFIPGIFLIFALSCYCFWYSYRHGLLKKRKFSWQEFKVSGLAALPEAVLPIFVLGSIYSGFSTVSEAASLTAFYVIIIEFFYYKDLSIKKDFLRITNDSMSLVGGILLILCCALGFTNYLIDQEVPLKLFAIMREHVSSQIGFIVFLNIFLLVIGSLMDIFTAIVVIVPLIIPIAVEFKMDQLHLAINFLTNLEIGYITPPVGLNLFLSSFRFKRPVIEIYKICIPFMIVLLLALSVIMFFPSLSHAEDYQMPIRVGEISDDHYYGAYFPEKKWNHAKEKYLLMDEYYSDNWLNKTMFPEGAKLKDFYFYELPNSQMCSVHELNSERDYIQYLFRLVSISYLFEAVKQNFDMGQRLGDEVKACVVTNDLFKKCNAKSADMKKFILRAQSKNWGAGRAATSKLSKLERETMLLELQKRAPLDAGEYFISKSQSKNVVNLANTLAASCTNIKNQIQSLCSETDSYWGLAKIPLVIELIRSSNAFLMINKDSHGLGCLNRFAQTYSRLEKSPFYLADIFETIFNRLNRDEARYAQGELFVPGSLKEFDEKGLEEFLYVSTPVKAKVEVKKEVSIKVLQEAPKVVEVKKEEIILPKVEEKKVEVVVVPEVKVSAFSFAVNEKIKNKAKSYAVDMNRFKKDYIFEPAQIAKLRPLVEEYQGREALLDMKELDFLGTAKEPVKLKFIKFLIDFHYHQGLFNMVAVLGNQFYLQNDLEGIETPYFVEIRNDESTKNTWQILLTDPPKPKKEGAEAPSPKTK